MISLWRNRRRLLVSERWGGYIEFSPAGDRIHNPAVSIALLAAWTVSAACLAFGVFTIWAAALNAILCRHYFIGLRWKSLARGCGAPGFIANWLAVAVFLLELTAFAGILPELRLSAVRMLRVDFALIFLSAGFYKYFGGYKSGSGMEYGMANPMWGYWSAYFSKIAPGSLLFKVLNFFAWFFEIVAAVLMLIPALMGWGGLLFSAMFVFILTQIRLGFLCHMAILIGCVYSTQGDVLSGWCVSLDAAQVLPVPGAGIQIPVLFQKALAWALTTHTFLIPICFAGLWYNHLGRRRLPGFLQTWLDRYTNWFGVIIWRVFSSDLTRFRVTIFAGAKRETLSRVSRFGESAEFAGGRYQQVYEAITAVCLFTTLNYYPDRKDLFHTKLLRYAKTLESEAGFVRFDIDVINKASDRFVQEHAASYTVDLASGSVIENERIAGWFHPVGQTLVHAGQRPGSYAS
jgi:hypothetical protein